MHKKTQNFSNHVHYVPLYHYLTFAAMAVLIGGGVYLLISNNEHPQLLPALFLLLVLTLVSVSFHCRSFALKVQDRAIQAEEHLRYFILTGKRLPLNLTLKQIFALRFADDQEFIELVERTINEDLTPTQIKKAIKNWKPDYLRA